MKNLPKIHYWIDRIDRDVITVHAVRGRGDRPSNGVFLLMSRDTLREKGWRSAIAELETKLRDREHRLANWYGRDWRNHLCARIKGHAILDDFERA